MLPRHDRLGHLVTKQPFKFTLGRSSEIPHFGSRMSGNDRHPKRTFGTNLSDNFGIALPVVSWSHFSPRVNFYMIERVLKVWAPTNVFSRPQRWLGQEIDALAFVYRLVGHRDR